MNLKHWARRGTALAVVLCAGMVGAAGGAQAAVMSFEGQQVLISEFLFDESYITAEQSVVVGDGPETTNFGSIAGGFFRFDIDLSASQIKLTSARSFDPAPGTFGFIFTDEADAVAPIATAQIISSEGYVGIGDDAVQVIDGGNGLAIDWENVGVLAGSSLTVDLTFVEQPDGVIPLPATLPLALGGFAALAGLARRRRA